MRAIAIAGLGLATFLAVVPLGAAGAATLQGEARSDREGPMEGVVVTATRDGSTLSYSVVTDERGRYAFPVGKLSPGLYSIAMRATRYDLAAPVMATVAPDGAGAVDLRLVPVKDIAPQLTSAEWLASIPGTDAQKQMLLNCSDCHTLERIIQSTHTAEEFTQVFDRMAGYYPGAWPEQPQRLVGDGRRPPVAPNRVKEFLGVSRQRQFERAARSSLRIESVSATNRPGHEGVGHRIRPAPQDHPAT
jgi:virginiamycin B lyase